MAFAVRLSVLGLVFAASLASGCAGQDSAPAGLHVEDDFSDCGGWSTDQDEVASFSCVDGGYRILVTGDGLVSRSSGRTLSTSVNALSVEADASYRAGPTFALYGVACWAGEKGYTFAVSPGGDWTISRDSPRAVLAESDTEHAIAGLSDVNRIRGDCVGGQDATALTLYVNGKRIATATDGDGTALFTAFGFFVLTARRGPDVRFDNVLARELTEAEVR